MSTGTIAFQHIPELLGVFCNKNRELCVLEKNPSFMWGGGGGGGEGEIG